jgi:hypothetical protein
MSLTPALAALACWGCGNYEERLEQSLNRMKEQARLDQYLNPPVGSNFQAERIALRTPRPLPSEPSDFGLIPGLGNELFDIRSSFVAAAQGGGTELGLHVLGRHKAPPRADAKNAPPQPDLSQRGDFTQDVLNLLGRIHSEIQNQTPTKVVKKSNEFNRWAYTANNNAVEVYVMNRRIGNEDYNLALIWEVPPKNMATYRSPIDMCLETLAVGPDAARSFNQGPGGTDAGF